MSGYRGRRSYGAPTARWMALKYAGTCSVCGERVPVGVTAFYSPADRSVTCSSIPCAKARGLTRQEWVGSPVSGAWVDVLADGALFRPAGDPVRDPGEDMADRWNESH